MFKTEIFCSVTANLATTATSLLVPYLASQHLYYIRKSSWVSLSQIPKIIKTLIQSLSLDSMRVRNALQEEQLWKIRVILL
jgi:hypothetical protein